MAEDKNIDIVYIATVTPLHCEHAAMCMESGKNVLCEKPLAANGGQARQMANKARESGVFLMEAMWSRFLPANREAAKLVSSGAIGNPKIAQIDIGVRLPWDDGDYGYKKPETAGGTLIGAGVYAVAQAYNLLSEPTEMASLAHIGETGVDEQNAIIFKHACGALSLLSSSIRTVLKGDAAVFGDGGSLHIPAYQNASSLKLCKNGCGEQLLEFPMEGYSGFAYEIREAEKCIREGRAESSVLPLDESVSITETDQKLRNSWGLFYPGDKDV